jgi:L-threonylcarbamoyladenylate synthase
MGEDAWNLLLSEAAAAQVKGKKVAVLAADQEAEALAETGIIVYRLGTDLSGIARRLYAGMRWLDDQGVDLILCRDFGESGLGLAIRDRLMRAATRVIG